MEQVTGIEPASPAWKAGALAIELHPHAPSVEIVSFVIIAYGPAPVKKNFIFPLKFFHFFVAPHIKVWYDTFAGNAARFDAAVSKWS